jgi:hypothetical protein
VFEKKKTQKNKQPTHDKQTHPNQTPPPPPLALLDMLALALAGPAAALEPTSSDELHATARHTATATERQAIRGL